MAGQHGPQQVDLGAPGLPVGGAVPHSLLLLPAGRAPKQLPAQSFVQQAELSDQPSGKQTRETQIPRTSGSHLYRGQTLVNMRAKDP